MATLASLMVSLGLDASGFRKDAQRAEQALGGIDDQAQQTEEAVEDMSSGMSEGMKTAGKAAGAAGAAAIGAGLVQNINIGAANAKLAAQLGLSGKAAGRAGQAAGELFTSGIVESYDEAAELTRSVVQNMNLSMRSANFQPVARQVHSISEALGSDLSETTRAAGQLLRNDLAPSATAAMDLIAAGTQKGLNRSDDFLDTLNEYSVVFDGLGLSGKQSLGLLRQGLRGGARDTDQVADALKEFRAMALDSASEAGKAFGALGLDANKMRQQIAQGGPAARQALGTVLQRIQAIEDPTRRAKLQMQLFGTRSEDLAGALNNLNLDTAAQGMGRVDGAGRRLNQTLTDTAQNKIQAVQNRMRLLGARAVNLPGPLGTASAGVAAFGSQALDSGVPKGVTGSGPRSSCCVSLGWDGRGLPVLAYSCLFQAAWHASTNWSACLRSLRRFSVSMSSSSSA